ncbi:MAG: radical SAM family heme chaperone HemW [Anaeroplasmataceae bacterium]
MRGLYIHIPFCNNICNYCDFHKMVTFNRKKIDLYIDLIIKEIKSYDKYLNEDIKTIYIGGGTPNILDNYNLEKLLSFIFSLNLNIDEYTIEVNPELLTIDQVKLFKKYGINRVSLGAENFNNDDLLYLGRHHTSTDIINSINMLRANDILNINIDIIYGYPMDTLKNLEYNLNIIKELKIPHISLYSLILEENTIFYHKCLKNEFVELDADIVADMMDLINDKLIEYGYHHYEISNYSYNGFESKHNMIYWKSLEYIGIGLGASGYLDSVRYDNNYLFSNYKLNYKMESNLLSISDKKKEFFLLGLRMLDGVSINEYKTRFNSDPLLDFNFERLLKENLIEISNDIIKVTNKGYMLENIVAKEFI